MDFMINRPPSARESLLGGASCTGKSVKGTKKREKNDSTSLSYYMVWGRCSILEFAIKTGNKIFETFN
jgi:hypothetical protein